MASESLQLREGIAKVRLRRDLIAVPDLFQARRKHGERLMASYKGLRQDQLGLGERAKVFARSLCAIGGKCAEILKARDACPVGAMNGHEVVAAPRRFARREYPLLPGPQWDGRSLQRHFLHSCCAKPSPENPVTNEHRGRPNPDPQKSIPTRRLTPHPATAADER